MASTVTTRGTGNSDTTITILSFTLPADHLGLLYLQSQIGGGVPPTIATVGGTMGGTWTVLENFEYDDGVGASIRHTVWYYMPSSNATGTITLTEGATGWDRAIAMVVSVDEMPTSGTPRGADAIVQSAHDPADGSSYSASSVTSNNLDGTGTGDDWTNLTDVTNNVMVGFSGHYESGGSPTEITFDDSQAWDTEYGSVLAGVLGSEIGWNVGDDDTTPGASWTTSAFPGLICVELDNDGAAPSTAIRDVIGGLGIVPFAR